MFQMSSPVPFDSGKGSGQTMGSVEGKAGLEPLSKAQFPRLKEDKKGFYLVLAYLLFEFGRPQELIPGLKAHSVWHGLICTDHSESSHVREVGFFKTPDQIVASSIRRHGDSCADCRKQLLGPHDVQRHGSDVWGLSWHRDLRQFSQKR